MKKSILQTLPLLAFLGQSKKSDRTSYPAEPTRPNEDMESMLIQRLPELPPMHIMPHFTNRFYIPRRGKFKGYMRENRKCTFNKNK
jgi:hypothetical protein